MPINYEFYYELIIIIYLIMNNYGVYISTSLPFRMNIFAANINGTSLPFSIELLYQ